MIGRAHFAAAVAACALVASVVTPTSAMDYLAVVNNGSHRIVVLNVSPADADDWGRDRLGSQILDPGEYIRILYNDDDNCLQDVRAVYGNGHVERYRVDACHHNLEFDY